MNFDVQQNCDLLYIYNVQFSSIWQLQNHLVVHLQLHTQPLQWKESAHSGVSTRSSCSDVSTKTIQVAKVDVQ